MTTPRDLLKNDIIATLYAIQRRVEDQSLGSALLFTDELQHMLQSFQDDDDNQISEKWHYHNIKGKWLSEQQCRCYIINHNS